MTNEQLAARVQAGRREELPELWGNVERFVRQQAIRKAYALEGRGGVTEEDLYQSGFIAFLGAVDSFDPAEGKSFIGWLAYHLKTAFAEAAGYRTRKRRADPLHRAGSLEAPLNSEEDGNALSEVLPDPAAEAALEAVAELDEWEHLRDMLETALLALTELQRYVVRARYWNGQTLTQAAAERGISYETARKEEALALRALRKPAVSRPLREFLRG